MDDQEITQTIKNVKRVAANDVAARAICEMDIVLNYVSMPYRTRTIAFRVFDRLKRDAKFAGVEWEDYQYCNDCGDVHRKGEHIPE